MTTERMDYPVVEPTNDYQPDMPDEPTTYEERDYDYAREPQESMDEAVDYSQERPFSEDFQSIKEITEALQNSGLAELSHEPQ